MPRVNKAIELFEQGQPIFNVGASGRGYDAGVKASKTCADSITYDMEHGSSRCSGRPELERLAGA